MVHSIWIGVVGEGAADLDGPDLALHAGGVGGVEFGVREFLEVAQAHVADADADLVVASELDVFNDFGKGGFGDIDGFGLGEWWIWVEGWRCFFRFATRDDERCGD